MNIYIAHSNSFDYEKELYEPIKKIKIDNVKIQLPHDKSKELFNSKKYFKECDLIFAEVTHPSTGLGIELGWADIIGVEIICLSKEGGKVSNSLKAVTENFITYTNKEELKTTIEEEIKRRM